MTGTEIYKRTATYDAEARTIRIHAPEWKVLLAYDGHRSLAEVAQNAEVAYAEAISLTKKFLDKDWIAEEPITLEQYMKRIGAKDISSASAVVPPTEVLHDPDAPKPKPASSAAAPATPAPAAPIAPAPAAPTPAATPTPKPASAPTPATPPPLPTATAPVPVSSLPEKSAGKRTMKLGALVDYITSLVGNVSLGQILVYRVFLRVPPELLLAEDIASVHLSGDTSVVNGEKLQQAIAQAVSDVMKKTLPDSVFA